MKSLCIDFETANQFTGSICSVGIAIVDNNEIVFSDSWLIKPHMKYYYFNSVNIGIHGITKNEVATEPEFDKIYIDKIQPLLKDSIFVAHNAVFDMSALRNVLDLYKIPYPNNNYICTCILSRNLWPELVNHKLNTVSGFLNHTFKHHDAYDDAVACSKILLEAFKITNTSNPEELVHSLGISLNTLSNKKDLMYNINSYSKNFKKSSPIEQIHYEDATIEAQKVFSCIKRMKESKPSKIVASVLKGINNPEISMCGYNKLSTFGIMSEYEIFEIEKIIDEFAFQGYIIYFKNHQDYIPNIKLSEKSKFVLWKNAKVKFEISKKLLKKK